MYRTKMDEKNPENFYRIIRRIINNQDFQQKLIMSISVSLELYRVMISSLLIVFVPQTCYSEGEPHICTIVENLQSDNTRYLVGLIINFVTMCSFLVLYICEIRREEKLIKVLEVNNKTSTDNESVGKRLDILDERKKNKILNVDRNYQYISYFVICLYALNTVISGVIINDYSLGNQTMVIFLTNILFMITKLSNVYIIVNTDKNIFLSAYMNTKVQFNDIDPREMIKIERRRTLENEEKRKLYNLENHEFHEKRIRLIDNGGFEIIDNSSSSDSE